MKLLLTSAGITNKSLERALRGLVRGKLRIAFIPTAANNSGSDKHWLVKNYEQCARLGGSLDIVDVSALERGNWLPRLKRANVIVVGGGDTEYLMRWMAKSCLIRELPALLRKRVYVGISAGSIAAARRISASSDFLYGSRPNRAPLGLGYIGFNVRSHFNSPDFPKLRDRILRVVSKRLEGDLYALDDESGVMVVNDKVTVISEGRWKRYSGK